VLIGLTERPLPGATRITRTYRCIHCTQVRSFSHVIRR
jgi:hypothetical protein